MGLRGGSGPRRRQLRTSEEVVTRNSNTGPPCPVIEASGYYGELYITGNLAPRWFASMAFFLYIVNELLFGLAAATSSEADPVIRGKIQGVT